MLLNKTQKRFKLVSIKTAFPGTHSEMILPTALDDSAQNLVYKDQSNYDRCIEENLESEHIYTNGGEQKDFLLTNKAGIGNTEHSS